MIYPLWKNNLKIFPKRQEKIIIKKSFLREPKHHSFIWISVELLTEAYEYSYVSANGSPI